MSMATWASAILLIDPSSLVSLLSPVGLLFACGQVVPQAGYGSRRRLSRASGRSASFITISETNGPVKESANALPFQFVKSAPKTVLDSLYQLSHILYLVTCGVFHRTQDMPHLEHSPGPSRFACKVSLIVHSTPPEKFGNLDRNMT